MSTTDVDPVIEEQSVRIRVPFTLRRRGGRTLMAPDAANDGGTTATPAKGDPTILAALARAHLWQRMLDEGRYPGVTALAEAQGVKQPFATKMLKLTLLAPSIIEAAFEGRLPAGVTVQQLMAIEEALWEQQATEFEVRAP